MNGTTKIKNKIPLIIFGCSLLGGLSGTIPPMLTKAKSVQEMSADTTTWKSIKLVSTIRDTLTIEERVQKIEEMMSVDMNLMTEKTYTSTSHTSSTSLYTYENARSSSRGREFIKQYESLLLKAYKLKGEKRYTIGYGHVIYENDIPHSITKSYADKLFERDMNKFDASVRTMLSELDHRFLYTQGFVDGLVSLTYNCGPDGVRKTRFWKRMKACRYDKKTKSINKQDLIYAIEAVKTANISSIYKNGHQNRRKKEHNTMLAEV